MLFKKVNNKLELVKEFSFDLEKDIQTLAEKNLSEIFGLKFIATEFALNNLRIDTLAFDDESKSFVIIEYKKDRNISVIDQGYAYLSLALNNKADFILHYNETQKDSLKKDQVDWSQTRVIFVARSYTKHQKQAINFNDLPIELWKVAKYSGNIIEFDQLVSPETSESIKTLSKTSGIVQKVSKEVKKYTIDDHFKKGWEKSKELFDKIRENILEVYPNLEESPQKYYIGYKMDSRVLFEFKSQRNKLNLILNRVQPKDFKDPKKTLLYIKNSYKYYHKHQTEFSIKNEDDLEYALFLIKQIYNKFK